MGAITAIIALVLVVRLISWMVTPSERTKQRMSPVLEDLKNHRPRWDGALVVLKVIVGVVVLYAVVWLFLTGLWPVAIVVAILLLGFLNAWLTARLVTIPCGWVRMSWIMGRLSDVVWDHDRIAGGLVAALAAHRRSGRDEVPAWLRARVIAAPVTAGTTLAHAMLAEIDGDADRAEAWMRSVRCFDRRWTPSIVLRMATVWLMTAMAARGDFRGVVALPEEGVWSRAVWLLGACARAITGERVSPLRLRALWLLAPRRRASRPLLERALRALTEPAITSGPAREEEDGQDPPPAGAVHPGGVRAEGAGGPRMTTEEDGQDPTQAGAVHAGGPRVTTDDETMPVLERALARTRALGAVPAEERPSADLSRAASDWDEALSSPELLDRIDARLAALRSEADTYDVVDRLEATVTQALGRLAAGAATIEDRTGLLYGTTHVSVDAAFDRLQLLVDDLDARRRADDRLPVEDERDAWLGVCEAYGAIARSGTAEDRFDAFTMLWAPVCDFACWLWNVRWDYALSNAVHRWLLREAEAVDHPEGRELSAKNVACGK